jgi:hypothetical protein
MAAAGDRGFPHFSALCDFSHICRPLFTLSISDNTNGYAMESRFDIVTIASAICVAAYAAIALCWLALYDFGFSRQEIRGGAMIAIILIATAVAIDFFGTKPGDAR